MPRSHSESASSKSIVDPILSTIVSFGSGKSSFFLIHMGLLI